LAKIIADYIILMDSTGKAKLEYKQRTRKKRITNKKQSAR